ncbi:hypothetical protein IHE44_0000864 [Lamprotornis superbus]|uniref:protein-tyrosine-phosphatase n=1 Tax=Lamprotornis superbus TaxID=245042 RepID=A0A835U0U4_9PASS|nr:hypothetical protein IHE44_0000864 [Lamprotornis superbus]
MAEIRHKSSDYPHRVAKYPENRNRNRYRDVSPYDHSRVKLQNTENDYINASLVVIEEAQRYYILTQKRWKELSKEDQAPSSEQSPPHPTKITTEKYNGNSIVLENKDQMEKINTDVSTKVQDIIDGNIENSSVRKRLREDRRANTAQKLQQMKQKLNETERKRKSLAPSCSLQLLSPDRIGETITGRQP